MCAMWNVRYAICGFSMFDLQRSMFNMQYLRYLRYVQYVEVERGGKELAQLHIFTEYQNIHRYLQIFIVSILASVLYQRESG